VILVANLSVIV